MLSRLPGDLGQCAIVLCLAEKVEKELDHDNSHLHLDEMTKLLQDLEEVQAELEACSSHPTSAPCPAPQTGTSTTWVRQPHQASGPDTLTPVWEEARSAACQGKLETPGARAYGGTEDGPPSLGGCTEVKCWSGISLVLAICGLGHQMLAVRVSGGVPVAAS